MAPAPAVPKTIGKYRVLRPVPARDGEPPAYLAEAPDGGKVVVQTAADVRPDNRALILARLQNDAEVSAGLSHPGLVKVLDVGEDAAIGPFLVREYVAGPSLRSLPAMEVDLEAALRILIQATHALRAADAGGVAPRPLGLQHLFLTPAGQVKVTVFGRPHLTPPAASTSPLHLARVGLELIAGKDPFAEGAGAGPRIPAAFDKGLARTFARAISRNAPDRFDELLPFVQVMVAEAPLTEQRRQELLELTDRPQPILEDPQLASWVRGVWKEDEPSPAGEAAGAEQKRPPVPPARPAPSAAPASPPARSSRTGLFAGLALVLVAGAAAAWFTVGPGAKRPQRVSLLSAPPGALVELDGRALGATPLQIVDPPAGARLRLTLAGHLPADAAIPPDARELRIDMTPEPPPQPPPQPAPEASAAPPGTPASPTAATPEPAPEPKAPPAAAPEPEKARPKGTKAAKPPKKKPPEPPKKKNFDLFKHLERQAGTH